MRTVNVALDERSYPILIGPSLLEGVGRQCATLKLAHRCAIVSDSNVAPLYAQSVQESLEAAGFAPKLITVPAGESAKSLKVVGSCYDQLAEHRLERKSFLVALGGGVVGDLTGFLAATYMRGVAFVQVPTTLLSQVDSSVGGKVGINLKAGKNLVGAFYQPRFVACDLDTFKSLPEREFRSGLGEVIKYGVIYDAPFFEQLEREMPRILNRESDVLAGVVARCCEIKAEVVRQDETESGLRAILNFGHTVGHAIEAVAGYGKYWHGEAVSLGMVAAARLSAETFGLSQNEVQRIVALLERAGLPTTISFTKAQRQRMLAAMQLDKKVSAGEVKFVLARKIGQVEFGQKVAMDCVDKAVAQLG